MKLRSVNEKAGLPRLSGMAMAETKAQKQGQIEVTSVEKFLSTGAPDQHHQCNW